MKLIFLLVLVAVAHQAALGQKPADPEARNKHAISVAPARPANSVQPHRVQSDAPSIPKSGTSSARDLTKIERTSVQQMKAAHKKNPSSQAPPATQPHSPSKPIKFSYQPPKAAGKTTSPKNPPPPPVRSHP